MTQLKVHKDHRIALKDVIAYLREGDSALFEKILLEPSDASRYWVTDQDLYYAFMITMSPHSSRVAKLLETITIVPSAVAQEERVILDQEKLEQLQEEYKVRNNE